MTSGTSFVGRGAELARLLDETERSRLVTVTGPGGVGKTRLVEEAAPALRARHASGYRWFTFASAAPDSDAEHLSSVCGVDSPEALALTLGGGTSLVVLDNCEHVAVGAAELVARLMAASAGASVVTTSRVPLALPGEQVLVLAPLALDRWPNRAESPAVRLFFDRATAAGAELAQDGPMIDVVGELCRRLDALPLAIELAAARARTMTPAELLDLMDRRLELLTSRDSSNPRHETLYASIEASYALLTARQQRGFRLLALLPSSFDGQLAQRMLEGDGLGVVEVRCLLDDLVSTSLVSAQVHGERTLFRMLESIRELGLAKLRAEGEWDEANERLAGAMVAIGDDLAGRGSREWSQAMIAAGLRATQSLISAIEWCVDHDRTPERTFRLVLPLLTSMRVGGAAEVARIGDRLLDRWPRDQGPYRAEALSVLATAHAALGDYHRSGALAREALADPECSAVGACLARSRLAVAALIEGDGEAALAEARRGLEVARAAGLDPFRRVLASMEAWAQIMLGAVEEARVLAAGVVDDADRAHDPTSEIYALVVAATAAARAGDWEQVLDLGEQAESVARTSSDGSWSGSNYVPFHAAHRASAIAMLSGWSASLPVWSDALERALERGAANDIAVLLQYAARAATECGAAEIASVLADATPPIPDRFVPSLYAEDPLFPTEPHPARAGARGLRYDAILSARTLLAGVEDPAEGPVPVQRSAEDRNTCRREGDGWRVEFRGTSAWVRDLKGITSIALLLGRPNIDVHCLEVMGAADVGAAAGPALDAHARSEYKARILELQHEVDDAHDANDVARAAQAELELDALVEQLSSAFGLTGRDRGSGSSTQRARAAATYRIRSAIKKLDQIHPELGRHLENSVRTGVWCSYRPERPVAWETSLD